MTDEEFNDLITLKEDVKNIKERLIALEKAKKDFEERSDKS